MPAPARAQLLGTSPSMVELREQVKAAGAGESPVLLLGERGSGREFVARLLHESGPRRHQHFVRVDADEDQEPLKVDDGLARAVGGTLLVKEIAHVGPGPQRKLLRALRKGPGRERSSGTGEYWDVRLIAASDGDLSHAVADQRFDAELYERLGAVRLQLVPLRRRPDDVPLLLDHFGQLEPQGGGGGQGRLHFSSGALQKLTAYSWPCNISELRDVVRRLQLRNRRGKIELADVEAVLPEVEERVPVEQLSFEEMVRAKIRAFLQKMEGYEVEDLYEEVISRVERPLIELVLERTGNSQVKAAKMLGLNRNTLRKKIAERQLGPTDAAAAGSRRAWRPKAC